MAKGITITYDDLVSVYWHNGSSIPSGSTITANGTIVVTASNAFITINGTSYTGYQTIDINANATSTLKIRRYGGYSSAVEVAINISGIDAGKLRVNGKPLNSLNGKKIRNLIYKGTTYNVGG